MSLGGGQRLTGADLTNCDLTGADLTGVRAVGTILSGADLRRARIDPTLWTTARLAGAVVDVDQALLFALSHGLVLDPVD
jgi:uncharacterized protein YjbI with pentapeptide repeats